MPPFHLIFADPPYAYTRYEALLAAIQEKACSFRMVS